MLKRKYFLGINNKNFFNDQQPAANLLFDAVHVGDASKVRHVDVKTDVRWEELSPDITHVTRYNGQRLLPVTNDSENITCYASWRIFLLLYFGARI